MTHHVVDLGDAPSEHARLRWQVWAHDGDAPLATFAAKADAHLFAAAPGLLAALQDAAQFMEAHFAANKRLDKQLTDERMSDIRAALAKVSL